MSLTNTPAPSKQLFDKTYWHQFWKEVRILFLLTWPIAFTQVAQASFGLIDSVMAGNYSAHDLAAVAIGAGLWLPCILMLNGIMVATTPLISEAVGAKKLEQTPIIAQKALWIGLLFGLIGMVILNFAPLLFDPLQVPQDLRKTVLDYLNGVQWTIPATGMYAALRGYTEGLGKPKPVMIVSLLGLAATIPLNWVFIYGYGPIKEHGGAGCGYANSIVFWGMTIALATYLYLSKSYSPQERLFQRLYVPTLKWANHFLSIGLPIGIAIFFEVSLFSIAALILSPLGANAIAAHQIALSITSILFMLPLSLALALTIQMGQLYGAKAWSALKFVARTGFFMATLLAVVNIIIVLIFRYQLIHLFTADTKVVNSAAALLICAAAYQIFDAWQVSSAAMLRGIQDTKITMWITLVSYWLIAFPVGVYLARYTPYGAIGFWLGLILGLAIAALFLTIRLYYKLNHLSNNTEDDSNTSTPIVVAAHS